MILVVLGVTYLSPEPSLKTVSLAISSSISSQEVFVTAISVEEGLCFRDLFPVYICAQVFGELDDFVTLLGTK